MNRTDAILAAIVAELRKRKLFIDESNNLSSVSICVKLQEGPSPVRAIIYEDQQMVARNRRFTDT